MPCIRGRQRNLWAGGSGLSVGNTHLYASTARSNSRRSQQASASATHSAAVTPAMRLASGGSGGISDCTALSADRYACPQKPRPTALP